MAEVYGDFGGEVIRTITVSGASLKPKSRITAEQALSWPYANRKAMGSAQLVMWYQHPVPEPDEDDEASETPKGGTRKRSRRGGK